MTALVAHSARLAYEQACQLLAEACRVEQAKEVRNQADAVRHWARQAGNRQLEIDAVEIRFRAERRIGEMMLILPRARGKRTDLRLREADVGPLTLKEHGISHHQAERARYLASLPLNTFNERLAERRQQLLKARDLRVPLTLAEGKSVARARCHATLAQRTRAFPGRPSYNLVLADPPWSFKPWSDDTGSDRSAANHYAVMTTAEIAALPVPAIAAPDCILFLWATAPMLFEAGDVLRAWGFEYRTGAVWDKVHFGTGYIFRNQHEHLLYAVRGKPPAPEVVRSSVITAKRGKHSAKPEAALQLIEAAYPELPKIELFRRGPPRPGWDAWGNEAELGTQAA